MLHAHAVEHHGAVGPGLAQYAHHQTGIIGQRIDKTGAAQQVIFLHPGRQITQLLRVMEVMAAPPGQCVIDGQQTTQHPRSGKTATVMRHHETHRLHQPRRLVEQALAFAD
ncbi:hypothetical protein D3C73_1034110 [compost metagenome]